MLTDIIFVRLTCAPYLLTSGAHHEKRQDKLVREGISKAKMQGIISVGKSEAPSFGIEDQFSKSEYLKTNIQGEVLYSKLRSRWCGCKYLSSLSGLSGLVEARKAGEFTPRKRPVNNPSANPSIRSKWTTGVVLSTEY